MSISQSVSQSIKTAEFQFGIPSYLATCFFTGTCPPLIVSDRNVETTEQKTAAGIMKNYVNVFIKPFAELH